MPMSQSFRERLFPALPAIIRKFGSPFHIYDELGIRQTIRRLKAAFTSRSITFQEFYAVKALPKPAIMDIIMDGGCGFDCSSIPELRLARNAGAKPEDIMFTSNNTSQEEFMEARLNGGCILNLDGIEFIRQVPKPFPELICFRLNPGNQKTGDEVNSIIGDPLDSKYGVPIENILEAFGIAQRAGATRFGLHTMVCSNDRDYKHMVATVKLLLEVATHLFEILSIKLEFINMGGGIGIPYHPDDQEFDIDSLASACQKLLADFAAKHGYAPKLFMESGRAITGPHGVLVNKVINVYSKYKDIIGVQVAMPALMRVGMYSSAYHHCELLYPDGTIRSGEERIQTVAGPICENCDVLAKGIMLPPARRGDIIITHDAGAHGSAMGFNYNGRCRPQELILNMNGTVRRICRAETYDDLDVRHHGLKGEEHMLKL